MRQNASSSTTEYRAGDQILCAFGHVTVGSRASFITQAEAVFVCPAPSSGQSGCVQVAFSPDAGATWLLLGSFEYVLAKNNNVALTNSYGQLDSAYGLHTLPYGSDTFPLIYGTQGLPSAQPYTYVGAASQALSNAYGICGALCAGLPPAASSVEHSSDQLCIVSVQYTAAAASSVVSATARIDGNAFSAASSASCQLGSKLYEGTLTPAGNASTATFQCILPQQTTQTDVGFLLTIDKQLLQHAFLPFYPFNTTWVPDASWVSSLCFAPRQPASESSNLQQTATTTVTGLQAAYAVNRTASFSIMLRHANASKWYASQR